MPDAEVNEESGDEEEIVKKMTKLIDDLEKAIQDDFKPQDERRRYLKKVKFLQNNNLSLLKDIFLDS